MFTLFFLISKKFYNVIQISLNKRIEVFIKQIWAYHLILKNVRIIASCYFEISAFIPLAQKFSHYILRDLILREFRPLVRITTF